MPSFLLRSLRNSSLSRFTSEIYRQKNDVWLTLGEIRNDRRTQALSMQDLKRMALSELPGNIISNQQQHH